MDTIAALLEMGHDDDVALLAAGGEAIDYATLRREVHRLADQLRSAGIGASDRVAIVLPNGPEMALVFLAASVVGCAAPLNPAYREEEFHYYLTDLGVKALITPEGEMAAAHAARPEGAMLITTSGSFLSLDLTAGDPAATVHDEPTSETFALVLHTSGTTARPKIVPLRQRNLARSARNVAASLGLNHGDRSLNVMPLFHIHGLVAGLLAPLSAGGSVICTPGFSPLEFHRWLEVHQPTYYSAVPTMHQAVSVMARSRGPRSTSLRLVRSSSASLPGPVLESLHELFNVPVIEAYGMTEAAHQMASNPLPPGTAKRGSVGRPTGIDIAVLDRTNQTLPPGGRGEVGIRGATVFDGYENNPDANKSSFTGGWFRTGDEGFLDEDGYLYLTGRLKEQINRGGEKIGPLEIDEVLLRHPSVAQAVTFAIPHDTLGEEIGAAVVLVEGPALSAEDLRSFVAEQVAPFKVPSRILILEDIPKGATGKIQRIGLAERLGLVD
jgi:acyl-CoA synthetase (AMP-forming)/AMP-acid ligase II